MEYLFKTVVVIVIGCVIVAVMWMAAAEDNATKGMCGTPLKVERCK